jgi:uncharacterized delta-60 repeat protein
MSHRFDLGRHGVRIVLALALIAIVLSAVPIAQTGSSSLALVRYTPGGNLDATFGAGGRLIVPPGSAGFKVASVATDGADRIVLAGTTSGSAGDVITLVRLNPGGSLDATFGQGGVVRTDFPLTGETVHDLAIDRFGRLLVTGHLCCIEGRSLIFLNRYLPNGTRDPAFGVLGVGIVLSAYASFTGGNEGHALALDPFDRIIVAGRALNGGNDMIGVARFTRSGRPDPTFDGDGVLTSDLFVGGVADAVSADGLGRVTVAGTHFIPSPVVFGDVFAAVRFQNNGAVDTSFGDQGLARIDVPGTDRDILSAGAALSGGRLVAAGGSLKLDLGGDPVFQGFFSLAAFAAGGTPDPTFGTDGTTLTPWFTGGGVSVHDVAVDAAGLVLVAGSAIDPDTSNEYFALARYADGVLDPAFGMNGLRLTSFGQAHQRALAVAVDTQGRIVLAGEAAY